MSLQLPSAAELTLSPGEETPVVSEAHGKALAALMAQNLPAAQRLTADLIDMLDARVDRLPGEKTMRLIDFVVLLS